MKCEYGCGNESKFQLKCGKWCCSEKYQQCDMVRKKNSEGLIKSYKAGHRNHIIRSKTNLEGLKKGNITKIDKAIEDIKINGFKPTISSKMQKDYLINYFGIPAICDICKLSEWQNKPLNLQIHHRDGNHNNNHIENLQLLCPNCHSQTKNYCGKNINTGRTKVTDEQLLEVLKIKDITIRQALITVGLVPKGDNYKRIKQLKLMINGSEGGIRTRTE